MPLFNLFLFILVIAFACGMMGIILEITTTMGITGIVWAEVVKTFFAMFLFIFSFSIFLYILFYFLLSIF